MDGRLVPANNSLFLKDNQSFGYPFFHICEAMEKGPGLGLGLSLGLPHHALMRVRPAIGIDQRGV
jgi:hypothetical protein